MPRDRSRLFAIWAEGLERELALAVGVAFAETPVVPWLPSGRKITASPARGSPSTSTLPVTGNVVGPVSPVQPVAATRMARHRADEQIRPADAVKAEKPGDCMKNPLSPQAMPWQSADHLGREKKRKTPTARSLWQAADVGTPLQIPFTPKQSAILKISHLPPPCPSQRHRRPPRG